MSNQNRRQFLVATAAVGLASAIPGRASETRTIVNGLQQAIGQELDLTNLACSARNTVRIHSVEDLPGHGFKQFIVHMEGAPNQQVPEGLYRACSVSGEVNTAIHIMPTGRNQYAAYFVLVED